MGKTYNKDLVTLVTPGWNGKSFVHRLLDSILLQTYRPIQYIYVDDGSTDGTLEFVAEYRQKFAEAGIDFLLIHQENAGLCEAIMKGLQYVTGFYLSCPEYDDILLPESVEKRVNYLNCHPDCAVVVADAWVVSDNNLDERKFLISHKNPNRFDRNHFYQCLMSNTIFNSACYMIRMDRFDETHPNRLIYNYKYGSNQQILLPLYYHWNRGFIDEPLSLMVVRQKSLSKPELIKYEDYIERLFLYQETIYQTLDSIVMDYQDRQLFKERVEINVKKDILELSYKYNKKSEFLETYQYLESKNELPSNYILKRKEMGNKVLFYKSRIKNYIISRLS